MPRWSGAEDSDERYVRERGGVDKERCAVSDNRQADNSRDGRPDCRQLVVGLVVDMEGFLKRHGVYEGNRHDITTVQGIGR